MMIVMMMMRIMMIMVMHDDVDNTCRSGLHHLRLHGAAAPSAGLHPGLHHRLSGDDDDDDDNDDDNGLHHRLSGGNILSNKDISFFLVF